MWKRQAYGKLSLATLKTKNKLLFSYNLYDHLFVNPIFRQAILTESNIYTYIQLYIFIYINIKSHIKKKKEMCMDINFEKPLFVTTCFRQELREKSCVWTTKWLFSCPLEVWETDTPSITNETLYSRRNATSEPVLGTLHRSDRCFRGAQYRPLFKRCFSLSLSAAHRCCQPAPTSELSSAEDQQNVESLSSKGPLA